MKPRVRYHQMLVSARLGGAEQLAIEIQKFIVASRPGTGELLVPEGGESEQQAIAERLPSRSYRLDRLLAKQRVPSLIANLELFTKLRNSTPGILHIHSPFVYGALHPLLLVTGLRTILHLHLDYTEEQLRWPLRHAPDIVIVCARFMQERVANVLAMQRRGRTRIVPIINAVDTERFTPGDRCRAKEAFGLEPNRQVFLMAANLAPHKGQETAIRAMSILVKGSHDPLLWLVGEERESTDAYSAHLRDLVAALGLSSRVQFLGFRRDVPQLLHAADCLLLPSTSEGLPLAILEAQASRVAVLAAPTAGIPEVIEHGRTGFLIPADDPEAYATTLASLMQEPRRAESIAAAAYAQVVSNFS
ncbi:MAG: glycosyltransferase family 4 protein, partial [Steroidobacteraceae bacterium]